jgi:hypothetical protein
MMPRYFFDFTSDGEAYDDPAGVEFDGDEEAVRQLLRCWRIRRTTS